MLKNQLHKHLKSDNKTKLGTYFDWFIVVLIILNVSLLIVDTFNMPIWYFEISKNVEFVSIVIFTIEYLLRLWISDLNYPKLAKNKARIKHTFSFLAIVDFLAIIPFYLPLLFPIDLRVLRVLRLVRLLRLFKLNRYTNALVTIGLVFKNKRSQLFSSMLIVSLLLVISSLLMFNVEHPHQPEEFKNAFSGIWWAVATLTTVGYGDIYPITIGGKMIAGVIAILGIGLVAVPTGIISAGFVEMIDKPIEVNKHAYANIKRRDRLPKIKR